MKLSVLTTGLVVLAVSTPSIAQPPKLESTEDKVSYGLGLSTGRNMLQNGFQVDPTLFAKGLADAFSKANPALTDEQIQAALETFQKELIEAQIAKNKKAAAEFLAANGKRQGVVTTKSGLQYEVLKAGTGPKPAATNTVQVHYHGTLLDKTVFDSSVQRGQPAQFPVNGVIKGWVEALQLMPVGSKWKLYIPSDLAYGLRGSPPRIGPGAMLIFEVELLKILQ